MKNPIFYSLLTVNLSLDLDSNSKDWQSFLIQWKCLPCQAICCLRFFMGGGGAGNSVCQFPMVGLGLLRLSSPHNKCVSSYKIGDKVVLHRKISYFSVQNRISIAKMVLKSTRLLLESIFYKKYSALISYFLCNRRFALIIKNGSLLPKISTLGWVCGAKKPFTAQVSFILLNK